MMLIPYDIMKALSEVSVLCGRYWIAPEQDNLEYAQLVRILDQKDEQITWPSGLIVPTLRAPAITKNGIRLIHFGMKKDFLPKILLNARSETITEKPMFKKLFSQGQRCLLPATAFYEPSPDKKGRKFVNKDGGMLYMAGLFDQSEEQTQFVIITRDADEVVAPSHNRMPLLLGNEELRKIWLGEEELATELLSLDTVVSLLESSAV